MRKELIKSMTKRQALDIIYMAQNGETSKRRIKVLQVGESSFRAYCYLRQSNRTFRIDNILALVPVVSRERVHL